MTLRRGLVIFLVLVTLILASWGVSRCSLAGEQPWQAFFSRMPLGLSAVIFIVIYVASSFILVDLKDFLKIAAALVFGAFWSAFFIWIAEMFNCWMLFQLARHWGRAWVERRFGIKGGELAWLQKLCSAGAIFILRVVPAVPYRILDVAYGLTAVSLRKYFCVSALASPVRIFWLQFILAAVGGAVFEQGKLMAYLQSHPLFLKLSLLYLAASLTAVFVINRRLK